MEKAFTDAETTKYEDTPFFLGFQMGMTPKEVKANCAKLVSSGKIIHSGGSYKYNIKDSADERIDFQTELKFDYYNDELYKLSLDFNGKNSKGQTYLVDIGVLFSVEFSESWGNVLEAQSYERYIKKDALDDYHYYYIKGNIIITGDNDSYVFTDAYRDKLNDQAHKESVSTDLLNDFNM